MTSDTERPGSVEQSGRERVGDGEVYAWTEGSSAKKREKRAGAQRVLHEIEDLLRSASEWRKILQGVQNAAEQATASPDDEKVEKALKMHAERSSTWWRERFRAKDAKQPSLKAQDLVGGHIESLLEDLHWLEQNWPRTHRDKLDYDQVADEARQAS
jgi:hypothetical protein